MNSKLKSRKLWVWIVWTVLAVASIFVKEMPRETVYQFYGFLSLAYYGSNLLDMWITNKSPVRESEHPRDAGENLAKGSKA